MITKDSFSITISKFSLVYQVVLVLLIAALIFGIIGYAILAPTLSGYLEELHKLKTTVGRILCTISYDIDFRNDNQCAYVGIRHHNGMGSQRSFDAGIRHGILLSL